MDQLVAWSSEPGLLPRIPSGSERGKAWRDVGLDELQALAADRDADIRFSADTELRRRGLIHATETFPAQTTLF